MFDAAFQSCVFNIVVLPVMRLDHQQVGGEERADAEDGGENGENSG